MTKYFYIFLFISFLPFTTDAQDSTKVKNAVYLDLGGIGGFGSLNYSRHFYVIQKFDFNGHVGISSTKFKDFKTNFNPQIIIPFGIHATFGNKHYAEIGLSSAYVSSVKANDTYEAERFSTINGGASIGYKYMKKTGGFLFRAYYSPLFERFQGITHWGGLSFGYAF